MMSARADGGRERRERAWFGSFAVALTLLNLILSVLWYLSPLALGFRQLLAAPSGRELAVAAYGLSYFAGIPLPLASPALAWVLDAAGLRRAAVALPVGVLLAFLGLAAGVLALLE